MSHPAVVVVLIVAAIVIVNRPPQPKLELDGCLTRH